jgi:hypothetical protein
MTTRRGPGAVTTILMLIPMLAVPVMALFGVPHFMPVVASPTPTTLDEPFVGFRELRTGQSDTVLHPVSLRTESESVDLFQPYGGETVASNSPARGTADSQLNQIRSEWSDPLSPPQNAGSPQNADSLQSRAGVETAVPSSGSGLSPGLVTIFDSRRSSRDPQTRATSATSTGQRGPVGRFERKGNSTAAQARLPVETQPLTWRQASQILNDLGVQSYSLSPGLSPGEFRFVCLVSSTDDPRVSRRFESNSTDPLIAVEQVITQVRSWTRTEIR